MTLKNHHNHYNVKFLKGYGHSISVKDSKLILKDCHDPFSEPIVEEWFTNNMPYEKIVLQGKGYLSTEALSILSENNRNVILLDNHGKPVTYLNPVRESFVATKYRIGQYDTFRDKSKREYLARQIISAKKESQIQLLQKIKSSVDTLPDKEAHASRIYFTEYAKFIPQRFEFSSRNQSFSGALKTDAKDIINCLLNYGYAVLAGEISKFVNGIGLDAYYGFLHKTHGSFQSLVYDVIEPFRWLVDYTVYKIANNVNAKQRIYLKDYARTKNGTIVLDYSLIKRFLEMLERTFQQERKYEFRHGAKTKDGLKNVQEITIAKITIQNLAEYCIGTQTNFSI
ncbi:MAG: CRISPR-associated endonuclease Cas1 [Nitrosarchaeum sp.]